MMKSPKLPRLPHGLERLAPGRENVKKSPMMPLREDVGLQEYSQPFVRGSR